MVMVTHDQALKNYSNRSVRMIDGRIGEILRKLTIYIIFIIYYILSKVRLKRQITNRERKHYKIYNIIYN
jgi:ABC-type sulfate/molybdate transport systems ATPase subunit